MAFEELIGHSQDRLRAFLFKLLAGEQNVDDVAQEVWINVLRGLHHLNDPDLFMPWLYRIAHNCAFRILRGKNKSARSIDEADTIAAPDEDDAFTADDAQRVHAAMDQLAPEHREVLLLRFMEEMTYEEMAAVTQCQIGTVRSRLHNAKRLLRELLATKDRP